MTTNIVDVHPDKITLDGVVREGKIRLITHLHPDLKLNGNSMLAINLQLEQLKAIHEQIGDYLDKHKNN
ncbi:hypothetical protein O5N96_004241 [Salmonella enterica]|nr:hypothetical protein [Salmonella enterica]EKG9855450.1 hypothetical protein [Salmonella enterica]